MALEGFAQALLEDYADRLNATGQDYCRHIINAARTHYQPNHQVAFKFALGYTCK